MLLLPVVALLPRVLAVAQLAEVKEEKDFAQFLAKFSEFLTRMKPKEKILIPGGWRVDNGVSNE